MILMKVQISMIWKLISDERDVRKESLKGLFVKLRLEDLGLGLMMVVMVVVVVVMVMVMVMVTVMAMNV